MARRRSVQSCRSGTAWKKFKLGVTIHSLRNCAKSVRNTRNSALTPSKAWRNSCSGYYFAIFEAAKVGGLGAHSFGQDQSTRDPVARVCAEALRGVYSGPY